MITGLGQRIRELRRGANLSQEQLAEKFGVTVQAVSKWECSQSYPDIELLLDIAGTFGVTVDYLLNGVRDYIHAPSTAADFPDDNVLRIVQYKGSKLLRKDEYDPDVKIPLCITEEDTSVTVEIWGSADIDGNINGDLSAGMGVSCDNVEGGVNAGMGVSCDNIDGNVNAGAGVTCDNVDGNINAGGDVTCENVEGNVSCGGDIDCGDIGRNASAGGDIDCGDIGGNAEAQGRIDCGDIEGDVKAGADIKCENIEGDVYCKGSVTCEDIEGDVTAEGTVNFED